MKPAFGILYALLQKSKQIFILNSQAALGYSPER